MEDSAQDSRKPKITPPVLIVDRSGSLGIELAKKISKDQIVIFVSRLKPQEGAAENIIHVPYNKKFPIIPDNSYSKTFLIDDAETVISSIDSFFKKAQVDRSLIFFITYASIITQKKIEEIQAANIKIYILGDVFGEDRNYSPNQTSVNNFIDQANKSLSLKIEKEGLRLSYPVYIDDVIDLLSRDSSKEENNKINFVLPFYPITDITLAHMLQKVNPQVRIDFQKNGGEQVKYFIKDDANFLLGTKYDLFKRIKNLNLETTREEDKVTEEEIKRSFLTPFIWIVFFFLFCLFLPLISSLFYLFLGGKELLIAKDQLSRGNLTQAKRDVANAKTFFAIAEKTSNPLLVEAKFLGKEKEVSALKYKIELGKSLSDGSHDLIISLGLLGKVFNGESKNSEKDFKEGVNLLKSSTTFLRTTQAEGTLPKELLADVNKLNPLIDLISSTSDFLPEIFGFPTPRKYMILFQNNMELRPGGGFIGSFATFTLDKGRVHNFTINNVYSADGQLKGHIDPPFALRRYLPIEHWYLRDSNFDLDFEKNSYNAAYLLDLSLNEKVDGVIGIDLSLVKNLVASIGNVHVVDYNLNVSANNLFLLTEEKSEKNNFAGSSQKKDFLNSLFKSIISSLQSNNNISYLDLLQGLSTSLSEKHIQLGSNDPNLQNISSLGGWSSSLAENRKKDSGILLDFLGTNEANLGVNKANYFVSRSASYKINILEDGRISNKLSISFKNNAKSNAWPGGNYKNYLRLIVPEDAVIEKVTINDKEQQIIPAITDPAEFSRDNFVPPQGLEVENYKDSGKTVFGFLVNIPINSLKNVAIEYTLPQNLTLTRISNTYSLKIFKQPGVDSFPLDLNINFPKKIAYIRGDISMKKNGNSISKQINVTRDQVINFYFSPK